MPRELPAEIRALAERRMPSTHRLLWVRGEFLSIEEIERPPFVTGLWEPERQGRPIMDTRVTIGDLDNAGEGYQVRLLGVGHDIAPEDTISLLGHEPVGKDCLTIPRLLYNHNTSRYHRIYTDPGNGAYLTQLDHKYILACKAPGTLDNRLRDISAKLDGWFFSIHTPVKKRLRNGVTAAVGLLVVCKYWGLIRTVLEHPSRMDKAAGPLAVALFIAVLGGFMLALMFCMYVWRRIGKAILSPPAFRTGWDYSFDELMGFDNLTNYLAYTYTDITYLYEDVCAHLGAFVEANPAPDIPFVLGQKRQTDDKGKVRETVPLLDASSRL